VWSVIVGVSLAVVVVGLTEQRRDTIKRHTRDKMICGKRVSEPMSVSVEIQPHSQQNRVNVRSAT
jgi:hypothetical protein